MGLLAGTFFSAGVLLDFAPTYNGAQSPTIVMATYAKFIYLNFGPGTSNASGWADIKVTNEASDSVISIHGSYGGSVTNNGSTKDADADIFTLNERPDSVKIRRLTADYTDSDHINYPSTVPKIGTFTDGDDFDPVNGVDYGYRGISDVESKWPGVSPPPGILEFGKVDSVVEFTFKKDGYNTLVLLYKLQSRARSSSSDLS